MKNRIIAYIIFYWGCTLICHSQNIIPNPSFSEYLVLKPGIYEVAPFNAKHWHSFITKQPKYYNAKSENAQDKLFHNAGSNQDLGDSSFVCLRFWDFYGSGDIISCEMTSKIKKNVEYELSFDYRYEDEISSLKLSHFDVLFSNSVTFTYSDGSSVYDLFHKYKSEFCQSIKTDSIINDGEWHSSKTFFKATETAQFFTLAFASNTDVLAASVKQYWKSYRDMGTMNLKKVENILSSEGVFVNSKNINIQNVTQEQLFRYFGANYIIDNISLIPIKNNENDNETEEVTNEKEEVVEMNIKWPIHSFSISGQVYSFKDKETKETIETDSMVFDNNRFFSNFREEKHPDYQDSIEHIITSRTMVKCFKEPYYYKDNREQYVRLCWFRKETPLVFKLQELNNRNMKLQIKKGNGNWNFEGNMTTDTTLTVDEKTTKKIKNLLNWHSLSALRNSFSSINDLTGMYNIYFDFNYGNESNTFVINDAYLLQKQIRKTEYEKVYELMRLLVAIADKTN